MPIMTELVVSVVGGVLTAAILAIFSRPGRAGGIAIAVLGGRMLIPAGILPQGLPTRLALLIGGTVACWVIIASGRR